MYTTTYKSLFFGLVVGLLLALSGCDDDDEVLTNDIQSQLVRSEIDPLSQNTVEAGSEFTITGSNMDLVTSARLSGTSVEILSQDASSLTFQVPRIFPIGQVSVTNKYRQVSTTEGTLAPIYPEITISSWPATFQVGKPITITGENVHLINQVTLTITDVNTDFHPASLIGTSFQVPISGTSSDGSRIDVPTRNLPIPYGATVIGTAEGYSAITENANSPEMTAIPPAEIFEAVDPIVLWDFEDGENPYTEGDIAPAYAGINAGNLPTKAIGQNYFSLRFNDVPSSWETWLGEIAATNIDVSGFNAPHLSFMVNTNGNEGQFQLAVTQGGVQAGKDMVAANTGVQSDDHKIKTTGWEWRSIPLEGNYNAWSEAGPLTLDPSAVIEKLALSFKQGNGVDPFEIHLDHVMITDGPVEPVATESFEGTVPAFGTKNGGSVNAVHLNNYFHHSYTVTKDWTKRGEVRLEGPFDLGELDQPYLNFWINTGGGTAFFQLVSSQNGVTFGHDPNGYELYDTDGEWQLISIPLAEVGWSNWSNTEDAFDAGAEVDFFAIDFNPGNQKSGLFEFNIDGLILSNGPMFYQASEE